MKKICFFLNLLLLMLTIVATSKATPTKAIWKREIFIGYNNDSYFSYLIERNQPGSYYGFSDYVFLCKYTIKEEEVIVEKILIRKTVHSDTTCEGTWAHIEEIKEPPNVENYLIQNHLFWVFPSDYLDAYKLILHKDGLFVERNKKKELLMDSNNLEKYAKRYKEMVDGNSKVVSYHRGAKYFYFVIQYGSECYDSDFYQSIVVVNSSDVMRAQMRLHEGE